MPLTPRRHIGPVEIIFAPTQLVSMGVKLTVKIAQLRANLPFPVFGCLLVMQFVFECILPTGQRIEALSRRTDRQGNAVQIGKLQMH